MSRDGDLPGRITRRAIEHVPDRLKRQFAGPYNRVQEVRADREFRTRSREQYTPADDAPRHVVCIVVDAFRADAVDPRYTPYLADRLVGSAVTPSPWTFPAVTSLVTGQYPHEHGSMRTSDESDRGATDLVLPPGLPADAPTLPDVFAGAGYETYGAFAFHMPFFALGGRFGTHALYDDATAETVLEEYTDWFATHATDRTFSYLHLSDLHEPVQPPKAYCNRHEVDDDIDGLARWRYETEADPGAPGERYRDHRERLYRAAADYVDDQLAALDDRLVSLDDGLAALDGHVTGRDDVALVVTGDHGEGLWEWTAFDAAHFTDSRPAYCVDHGGTPYESITRVPLVVDGLADVSTDATDGDRSLVDLAPTLLDSLGHPDALSTSGTSLRTGPPVDRVVLTEATRYGHERKAAYLDGWKIIVSEGDDEAVGFSLPTEEPTDLPDGVERRLFDALPAWPDGSVPERTVSGIARDRLEDLGYV